jgi:hypothetical protein
MLSCTISDNKDSDAVARNFRIGLMFLNPPTDQGEARRGLPDWLSRMSSPHAREN